MLIWSIGNLKRKKTHTATLYVEYKIENENVCI